MENLSLLTSMAIVLGIALVAGMFVRRLGLPVILGYLMGGIVIGPYGLALIKEEQDVETLATIGVVLLMFALGIEFSLKALRRVGRVAIIGGVAQILATIALGVFVGWLLDWEMREAILFGLFISLSSTIIVLRTLMERGDLGSTHGRVMIGILLVQDLSVVPMMVLIPSFEESGTALLGALAWAALKAMAFLGGILVLGLWVLPWLMRKVAEVRSREIFLLAIVCLGLGAAFAANEMGLSIALGAFVAGLLVSESDYAYQALADIRSLRDVFAVLFFVSLGMLIDPGSDNGLRGEGLRLQRQDCPVRWQRALPDRRVQLRPRRPRTRDRHSVEPPLLADTDSRGDNDTAHAVRDESGVRLLSQARGVGERRALPCRQS
jgi:CPA2 family monovalent cation:H+ antiporter-2